MSVKLCKPDLVLLDLMLPGLSGEEVLPKLRGIPVIVMSAKASVDSKVELDVYKRQRMVEPPG